MPLPVELVVDGPELVTAGDCSATITLTRQDAEHDPVAPPTAVAVALGETGAGQLYSAANCTGPVTTVAIPAGASSVAIYFSDTTAEALTLVFSAAGLTPATLPLRVEAAPPHRLRLSGVATVPANLCTTLTLTREDVFGNPAAPAAATAVTLGGQGYGHFYTSGACADVTTAATIVGGASSVEVFFASGFVEPTLTLTATGLTVDASAPLTVTGPFALPVTIPQATCGLPVGWSMYCMASADFDNDGNLDVAVTETWSDNRVRVAWGNGAGSFSPGPAIALPLNPSGVAAVSLRRNTMTDLVIANFGQVANTSNLSVILGNGDRTFEAPVHYNSSGTKAWASRVDAGIDLVSTGGQVDVVVSYAGDTDNNNLHSGVDIFPGNGDGTLGVPKGYAKDGISIGPPVVGDVDGDANLDFVVPVGNGDANATWFRNSGGGMGFTQELMNPGTGHFGTVWAFGDFNGDVFVDFAQALSWWGAFVDLGNGTAALNLTMGDRSVNDVGYRRVRTGVFTASGHTDAVFAGSDGGVPRPGHNGILFYPCNGDGTCGKVIAYHLAETMGDFVIGDFNGDGHSDLVALTAVGQLHFFENVR